MSIADSFSLTKSNDFFLIPNHGMSTSVPVYYIVASGALESLTNYQFNLNIIY